MLTRLVKSGLRRLANWLAMSAAPGDLGTSWPNFKFDVASMIYLVLGDYDN